MKGLEMMLKGFGLDPEQLKADVGGKIEEMRDIAQRFESKLDLAIKQNADIIRNQQQMYQLMVAGKLIPTVEDFAKVHQLHIEGPDHVNGNDTSH